MKRVPGGVWSGRPLLAARQANRSPRLLPGGEEPQRDQRERAEGHRVSAGGRASGSLGSGLSLDVADRLAQTFHHEEIAVQFRHAHARRAAVMVVIAVAVPVAVVVVVTVAVAIVVTAAAV